jgi:hypothetical protein
MDVGSFILGLGTGYAIAVVILLVEDFIVKKRY